MACFVTAASNACPLDFNIESPRGGIDMAVVTTVLDGSDGGILAHRLTPGWPAAIDVVSLLAAAFPGTRTPGAEPAIVAASGRLAELLLTIAADLGPCGLLLDEASSRGLRAGAASVPVLGRRLGRVALAPSRQEPGSIGEGVAFRIAAKVVDHLFADLPAGIVPIVGRRRLDGRADGPALRTLIQSIER